MDRFQSAQKQLQSAQDVTKVHKSEQVFRVFLAYVSQFYRQNHPKSRFNISFRDAAKRCSDAAWALQDAAKSLRGAAQGCETLQKAARFSCVLGSYEPFCLLKPPENTMQSRKNLARVPVFALSGFAVASRVMARQAFPGR